MQNDQQNQLNQIQQHIKRIIYPDQVGYPKNAMKVHIKKSINIIFSISKILILLINIRGKISRGKKTI